jgi:hypothetical protein
VVDVLMLPQQADQFENALACQEIGAALVLMPGELTPASVRSAVKGLLDDPAYSENARRVAAEISRMPPQLQFSQRSRNASKLHASPEPAQFTGSSTACASVPQCTLTARSGGTAWRGLNVVRA